MNPLWLCSVPHSWSPVGTRDPTSIEKGSVVLGEGEKS